METEDDSKKADEEPAATAAAEEEKTVVDKKDNDTDTVAEEKSSVAEKTAAAAAAEENSSKANDVSADDVATKADEKTASSPVKVNAVAAATAPTESPVKRPDIVADVPKIADINSSSEKVATADVTKKDELKSMLIHSCFEIFNILFLHFFHLGEEPSVNSSEVSAAL